MTTAEPAAPSWEDLTAPLDTAAPVILTPAARTEWSALTDAQAAGRATDQDLLDEWHGKAMLATFGPLLAWMRHASLPAMMP